MTQIERIDEKHGKDEIILTIFETDCGRFTYSLQCHVASLIRAIFPHQIDESLPTAREAKISAVSLIRRWAKIARGAQKRLELFDITECPYLRELDFG